jgi:uncharacterized membrane protein YidH (DUF202 family)
MMQAGKVLVLAGLLIVLFGLALWGLARMGFRGLPGDIRYETDSARIYIPIVTSIVASVFLTVLLTLVLWLWRWWGR